MKLRKEYIEYILLIFEVNRYICGSHTYVQALTNTNKIKKNFNIIPIGEFRVTLT